MRKFLCWIMVIALCASLSVGALADEDTVEDGAGTEDSVPIEPGEPVETQEPEQVDEPADSVGVPEEEPSEPVIGEAVDPDEEETEPVADDAAEISTDEPDDADTVGETASEEPEEEVEPLETDGDDDAPGGSCGDNAAWSLVRTGGTDDAPEYRLEITGSGAMTSYRWDRNAQASDVPWVEYADSIRSITVSGVNSIGSYAFAKCSAVESVSIADGVTSIGSYAFYACSRLAGITLPSSLTTLGGCAFYKCSDLSGHIAIPAGVTNIAYSTFENCGNITSVSLPAGLRTISTCAFSNCTKLTSAPLPESVTAIGSMAFYNCSSLSGALSLGSVRTIGSSAFARCVRLTGLTIPSTVTSIGKYAFSDCVAITDTVTIPASVSTVGTGVFRDCTSLKGVVISDGITSIGEEAFFGCSRMSNVTLPSSITEVGRAAFANCASLTSFAIPERLTAVPEALLQNCTSLSAVTIPDSITGIGSHAFAGCRVLRNVTLPGGLTAIEDAAFMGCHNLTSIALGQSIRTLGVSAFENTGLTELTIPSSITDVPSSAFRGCSALTDLTVDSSLAAVRESAFSGCSGLETIHYPAAMSNWNGVTIESDNDPLYASRVLYAQGDIAESGKCGDNAAYTIGRNGALTISGEGAIDTEAFRGRTDIVSVRLPSGITSVGANAFSGCSGITEVTYESSREAWERMTINAGNEPLVGARVTYSEGDILYSDKCGPSAYYTMSRSGDVVITGSGAVNDAAFRNDASIKTVEIRSGITSLGADCFSGCSALEELTIADSVTSIGANAFGGCSAVDEITVTGEKSKWDSAEIASGNDVIKAAKTHYTKGSVIESGTCGADTTYTLSNNGTLTLDGTTVDEGAFKDYGELRSVVFPETVTGIGADAFSGCTIGSVTYEGSADSWQSHWTDGSFASSGNAALKNATLYAADGSGEFSWEETASGRIAISGEGELGLKDWGELTGKVVMLDARTTGLTDQALASLRNAKAVILLPDGDYDGYAANLESLRAAGLANVRLMGDATGNGNILASDITRAIRYRNDPESLDELTAIAMDVNGDGSVTIADCILMGRYITGQITAFPAN